MKKLVVGLLGATALATTLVIVRQQRDPIDLKATRVASGDDQPPFSLERLRELGY